ncbi:MAG: hypothetical protein GF308_13355 [Candidatus Heimdallarchaeota archaeon]|nr:hypothetical protein [Candidatus Heimdallarchaeota archaeon]
MEQLLNLNQNKKAISNVTATLILIGIAMGAVAVIYGMTNNLMRFNSELEEGGAVKAKDYDEDGLIDKIIIPLLNTGKNNAHITEVYVIQDGTRYLWSTEVPQVRIGSLEDLPLIPFNPLQQIEPLKTFNIEIICEDSSYVSPGYVSVVNIVETEEEIPYYSNLVVLRTEVDDHHRNRDFPADQGFSPTLWFMLGKFEDKQNRINFEQDYLDLNGYGSEETFQPYLEDERTFSDGRLGGQTNYVASPYNDSGERPGLLGISGGSGYDSGDDYNFRVKGLVYMWTYLYVPGGLSITLNIGSNAEAQHKLWLNGTFLHEGSNRRQWYTTNDIVLNPGFNVILLKVGSTRWHKYLAGQILLFSSESSDQLTGFYSVWPTLEDLS